VVKHPYEAGLVHQWFTGVDPAVRGRGKWLKAAMLLHLRVVHPDTVAIETGNAGSNAPMLSINHQLGFRLRRTETLYQVDRETLASRV
jgi:mycothiol synthase